MWVWVPWLSVLDIYEVGSVVPGFLLLEEKLFQMTRIMQKMTAAITSVPMHPDEELDFWADCGADADAWGVGAGFGGVGVGFGGVGVGLGGVGFGGEEAACRLRKFVSRSSAAHRPHFPAWRR